MHDFRKLLIKTTAHQMQQQTNKNYSNKNNLLSNFSDMSLLCRFPCRRQPRFSHVFNPQAVYTVALRVKEQQVDIDEADY